MGFDNPYRNINRDLGCALVSIVIVVLAIGIVIGKMF